MHLLSILRVCDNMCYMYISPVKLVMEAVLPSKTTKTPITEDVKTAAGVKLWQNHYPPAGLVASKAY